MLTIKSEPVPLSANEHGVFRITGTRVSLDSVVTAFDLGATPEQIVHKFPTLKVDDVYAVITYYLRHLDEVQAYLAKQRQEAEALRQELDASFPSPKNLRQRLMKRQRQAGIK